jgi:hypothetical protein
MTDQHAVAQPSPEDARLEAYVLALIDEATQDEVEARAFGDAETAAAIDEVETRLVDAYVAGDLSGERLEAFTRALGSRPRLQARVRMARALAARPSPARAGRWWLPLLAAAAVLLIAGTWFVRQAMRPDGPPAQTASDARDATASDRTADADAGTATPAAESPAPSPTAAPRDSPALPRPASTLLAVTLPVGVSRAAEPFLVRVPASSTRVQVRIPIAPGDAFARYRVRMTDAGGRMLGVADPAPLSPDRTVSLTVERASLTDGLYEIAVEGLDAQGAVEPLTFQQVRITGVVPPQ